MAPQNYISASCTIDDGVVSKDGQPVLEAKNADLASVLLNIYQSLAFNYPKFYKMDNLSKLGWLASEVLLKDGFDKSAYEPGEVGLVLTNANSSLDADVKYWDSVKDGASPSLFVYTLPNIVIGEICIRNGFKGEHAFYITPQFDAVFIKQQTDYLLNNQVLKACICGWVEVIGERYKAALFLIENKVSEVKFTIEELNRIYN